jgi:predicted glycosyltransferase
MKLLIDIGHPAHVHLFKNVAWEMQKNGHDILFTCREKDVVRNLLDHYKFRYVTLGKHRSGALSKFTGLIKFNLILLRIAIKFKPDIFLSHGSFYAAQVATLLRKPHISLEDTGNMEQIQLYRPFTQFILTPSCFHKKLGKKQFYHNSYHELAYLSPNRFQPDPSIFSFLNLHPGDPYIILRFISWKATHDIIHTGIPDNYKLELVNKLSEYGQIFISSEKELPEELKKYSIKIPPERMHDAMYYARLFIGESLTMVSECAMLATPAIHVNTMTAGTLAEQEKYGLIFRFSNTRGLFEKAIILLKTVNLKEEWLKRRDLMLWDKIDLTGLIIWVLENYPDSINILKKNPEYQQKFKFA